MKQQHLGILIVAPTIGNATRLERQRTIFDLFRQFCGVLALLAAGMVHAAPVKYYFGGQLAYVEPSLSPAFAIGNEFNGTFTYESTTADSALGDPNRGFYGPGPAFAVTVNSLHFSIAGGGSGSAYVFNDYFGSDEFGAGSVGAVTTGPNINGFFPDIFYVRLGDSTHSEFSSDALPSTELDLALFDSSHFELGFVNYDTSTDAKISGALSYLSLTNPNATTSIPEPGNLALLGLGLAALRVSIKRNRSDCSQAANSDGYNVVAKILGVPPVSSIYGGLTPTQFQLN
jgi:hypothetical protein